MDAMELDEDKIDDAVLALLGTSKNVAIRPDAVRISGVGGDDRGC